MKYVIVGAGSIGLQLAKKLVAEDKDVVLIEKDAKRAKYADNLIDCMVLTKDGAHPNTMRELDLKPDDVFVSVTESDEINIIACNIATLEFNLEITVAKITSSDYLRSKPITENLWGIDFVVNPAVEAAKTITTTVMHGALSDIILFNYHKVQMRNLVVDQKSFFINKNLRQIRNAIKEDFLIAAIFRNNNFIIPLGETVVEENDIVSLLATKKAFDKLLDKIGKPKKKISNVIIVGGGKISHHIITYLTKTDRNIKIIEKDYEKCKKLARNFPETIVINSDILDEALFEEERLDEYDLIITLTANQELNILSAVYAKSKGVKRAIALVENPNFLSMATTLGIDSVINPKTSAVNRILTFLRSRHNVKNIYSLFEDQAEVIEFHVCEQSNILNKPVKDIKLPKDSLILSVSRGDKNFIPDGRFVLEAEDNVIVITKKECCPAIDKLFSPK